MICASLRCSDRVSSDTLVATPTGKTAISEIRVGDTVEAYDPRTGVTGPHTVTAVMAHTDPVVEHLVTDTGPIETTPNHPFFTTDRGWVEAGSLAIGEQVRTESRKPATVVSFTVSATPSTMWDLTVDGAHSFFVGSGAVLVHNFNPLCDFVAGKTGAAALTANSAVRAGSGLAYTDESAYHGRKDLPRSFRSQLISDLQRAGWPSVPSLGKEAGVIFTDPATGNTWRIMDGAASSGPQGPRLIVQNAAEQPLGVTGANLSGKIDRDLSHLELSP